jgi:hypothetical protein
VAQDCSKQAMSQEDEDFLISLHQQQEIEQAVAAIERGVSLSMVFCNPVSICSYIPIHLLKLKSD